MLEVRIYDKEKNEVEFEGELDTLIYCGTRLLDKEKGELKIVSTVYCDATKKALLANLTQLDELLDELYEENPELRAMKEAYTHIQNGDVGKGIITLFSCIINEYEKQADVDAGREDS